MVRFELQGKNSEICRGMGTESEILQRKLDAAERHYKFLLSQTEKSHAMRLSEIETQIKESWKWKIGNRLVESYIRCVNFVKNPLKFMLNKDFRKKWGDNLPSGEKTDFAASEKTEIDFPVVDTELAAKEEQPSLNVTAINPVNPDKPEKPTVAAIATAGTLNGFEPECKLVTLRPDNWKEILTDAKPALFLLESAPIEDQGTWKYKLGGFPAHEGGGIEGLVNFLKERGVPSLYWTHDHASDLKTDASKTHLFDRAVTLPHAVQPNIHNPLNGNVRNLDVCYAGSVNGALIQSGAMEVVLDPALTYGLHIYDDQFGSTGIGTDKVRFPSKYQTHVKGRLNFTEMVQVYRKYKVFLNPDSAFKGSSAIPRRVFELLASGTPVIANHTRELDELPGNIIFLTDSKEQTRTHLELLLNDRISWLRSSIRGIRYVMEFHTYRHRLKELLSTVGHVQKPIALPSITLLIRFDMENADLGQLAEKIVHQTHRPEVVFLLVMNEPDKDSFMRFSSALGSIKSFMIRIFHDQMIGLIRDSSVSDFYAVWDAKNGYGPDYLKDYALATLYSGLPYYGKPDYFEMKGGALAEVNPMSQFTCINNVPLSTLMFRREKLSSFNPALLHRSDTIFESFVREIQGLDPLNYVKAERDDLQEQMSDKSVIFG
jgi:hypothetical protein